MHETVKPGMKLFECVDVEIALNIAKLNGRTNAKMITKEEKATFKAKYESTARSLVRMGWLMNFTCHFLEQVINNPAKELVQACQEGYAVHLGPNHTWIVKKCATQAIKWSGTR